MNTISLMGRLTAEPELKQSSSGEAFLPFCIAVDRRGAERMIDFIDCIAFKGTAEIMAKYCHKGDQIGISGSLQTKSYETQTGEKRKAYNVIVNSFDFGAKKASSENQPAPSAPPAPVAPSAPQAPQESIQPDYSGAGLPFEI